MPLPINKNSKIGIRKIVFIACSPHSGSTLLESILSSHTNCVGIGEAFQLVDPKNRRIEDLSAECCSCGESVEQCSFWADVIIQLRNTTSLSAKDRYLLILRRFEEYFGPNKIIVDSSKVIRSLMLLRAIPRVDLHVIHLVKDVRAWTVSTQDNYRRNHDYALLNLLKKRGAKGILRYLQRSPFYMYHDWYWTQRRIESFLETRRIPTTRVTYEELCLSPENALKNTCDFLDLEFEPSMLNFNISNSHNVFGNRMRFDQKKNQKILYDFRWFYRRDWYLPSLLFWYIMSYNKRLLYTPQLQSMWER